MRDPDGGRDGDLDTSEAFSRLTRNPWFVIAVALLGGGTGGSFLGRPDPFTGTEGQALEERIEILERAQGLDDSHRQDAAEKYSRIRSIERDCAICQSRHAQLDRRLDRLEDVLQASGYWSGRDK